MRRRSRGKVAAATLGTLVATAAAIVAVVVSSDDEADAHGSVQVPASRVYSCRFEEVDNPMCAAAWAANAQALYDWMEVNIGDANGRHQQLIPDGELCSAGRDKYAPFDVPGAWPLTQLQPSASGLYDVIYTSTAPHATAYYRLFLTKAGFDARTDKLRWADLEQVYDSGPLPAAAQNRLSVALPARSEPAVLYTVWQRSDSPEAFYACSDVTIGGGGVPPTVPPSTTVPPSNPPSTTPPAPSSTTTPPATAPSPSPPPPSEGEPFSPVAGITATATTTASWDHGRCVEVRVDNTSTEARNWEVHYAPGGSIATLWNATGEEQHHDGHEGHVAFIGEDWNERLTAGQWTTFGMCVDT